MHLLRLAKTQVYLNIEQVDSSRCDMHVMTLMLYFYSGGLTGVCQQACNMGQTSPAQVHAWLCVPHTNIPGDMNPELWALQLLYIGTSHPLNSFSS